MQLLVYLAVHGGRAGRDQILEDLLGDAPRKRAPHRLNTYVYNLRVNLKRAGGPATYVGPPDQGYPLNRDALDIDLWNMQAAIAEADTATDAQTRIDALRRAVACYTGPVAEGRDYPWIEPYREAVRRQAIDAHLALVAALTDNQPQEAVQVLHAAIGHDPYAEPLYQQAMRLHARLGDIDAIRDLRRTLTRRMAHIDAEPGDDTLALADRLVTDLQRRPRRTRPLHGSAD
jgi:two-component SAPR family response regulator